MSRHICFLFYQRSFPIYKPRVFRYNTEKEEFL